MQTPLGAWGKVLEFDGCTQCVKGNKNFLKKMPEGECLGPLDPTLPLMGGLAKMTLGRGTWWGFCMSKPSGKKHLKTMSPATFRIMETWLGGGKLYIRRGGLRLPNREANSGGSWLTSVYGHVGSSHWSVTPPLERLGCTLTCMTQLTCEKDRISMWTLTRGVLSVRSQSATLRGGRTMGNSDSSVRKSRSIAWV